MVKGYFHSTLAKPRSTRTVPGSPRAYLEMRIRVSHVDCCGRFRGRFREVGLLKIRSYTAYTIQRFLNLLSRSCRRRTVLVVLAPLVLIRLHFTVCREHGPENLSVLQCARKTSSASGR